MNPSNSGNGTPSPSENLSNTRTKLERLRAEEPRVAAHVEKWRKHRPLTIDTLEGLQREIESLFDNCNVARQVGAAAAISGFISGVIGAVLSVKGHGSASAWLQGSKYATAAGAATVGTSNLLEAVLSQRKMNEIKAVIQKDIELTAPLRDWVQFSHEVDFQFFELLQCNVASPTFVTVMKACQDCMELLDAGSYEIADLIRDLGNCRVQGIGNLTRDVAEKLRNFFRNIQNNPEIVKPWRDICGLITIPNILQFVRVGAMIYAQINGIVPLEAFNLGKSGILGFVFDTIKLLFNLLTSVRFSQIKERQTQYCTALRRVRCALQLELDEVVKKMNKRELL